MTRPGAVGHPATPPTRAASQPDAECHIAPVRGAKIAWNCPGTHPRQGAVGRPVGAGGNAAAMASESDKTPVPVDLLRAGLYVTELDRPWIETPFLFQGFRIEGDAELEQLRAHCRFVYVDVDRSDADAVDAMWRDSVRHGTRTPRETAETAPVAVSRPSARARRASVGMLRGGDVYPDRDRFGILVQAAAAARAQSLHEVRAALGRVQAGRAVDVAALRAAADELADIVVEDASAALWLTCLKSHHEYTAVHSVNVAVLALALGAHLGLERQPLAHLGLGALLHDVGKIRVPGAVLDKEGPLTPEEAAAVRRHPQEGHDLVAAGGGVASAVLEIIRLHHERVGGHGYPLGLAGDRIPRHVRIAGLCDAYDAMTTARPHSAALPPDKALQTLYREAPGDFGVDLVQEFIRCLGIFPVGSVVALDNDAVGVVVAAPPGAGLWPTVLLVRAPDGTAFDKRLLVNLGAARASSDEMGGRRIKRALEPAAAGVDVGGIAAREFGLEAA